MKDITSMPRVTLRLPKDRRALEDAYAKVYAEIVADMLSQEELGYLISELKKKENKKHLSCG